MSDIQKLILKKFSPFELAALLVAGSLTLACAVGAVYKLCDRTSCNAISSLTKLTDGKGSAPSKPAQKQDVAHARQATQH